MFTLNKHVESYHYSLSSERAFLQRQKCALHQLVLRFFRTCPFWMKSHIRSGNCSSCFCHFAKEKTPIVFFRLQSTTTFAFAGFKTYRFCFARAPGFSQSQPVLNLVLFGQSQKALWKLPLNDL